MFYSYRLTTPHIHSNIWIRTEILEYFPFPREDSRVIQLIKAILWCQVPRDDASNFFLVCQSSDYGKSSDTNLWAL